MWNVETRLIYLGRPVELFYLSQRAVKLGNDIILTFIDHYFFILLCMERSRFEHGNHVGSWILNKWMSRTLST